jgi:phosphoribosyl-AMP cyclohydrolase
LPSSFITARICQPERGPAPGGNDGAAHGRAATSISARVASSMRRMAPNPLEEGRTLQIDFGKLKRATTACAEIVPVAVQNADTGEVILIAYANEEALRAAIARRTAIFWSTSRNELWVKGATSGETFELLEVFVNCEQNSLLYRVRPRRGGICHTQNAAGQPRNCYYRSLDFETGELDNLNP